MNFSTELYRDNDAEELKPNYADFENSTYVVFSKVAYLIGVPKKFFENEFEPPKMEWYDKLHQDKNARIVRNLCMLRTAIERNYKNIFNKMRFEVCGLHSMPEYIPQECISELMLDGISIVKSRATLAQYIIEINKHISNRINIQQVHNLRGKPFYNTVQDSHRFTSRQLAKVLSLVLRLLRDHACGGQSEQCPSHHATQKTDNTLVHFFLLSRVIRDRHSTDHPGRRESHRP